MLKCLRSLICPGGCLVPAPPVREFPSDGDDSLAQLRGQVSSRQVRGYSTPDVTNLATLIPSVGSMPTAASTAARPTPVSGHSHMDGRNIRDQATFIAGRPVRHRRAMRPDLDRRVTSQSYGIVATEPASVRSRDHCIVESCCSPLPSAHARECGSAGIGPEPTRRCLRQPGGMTGAIQGMVELHDIVLSPCSACSAPLR
jgi:hypothetical protein